MAASVETQRLISLSLGKIAQSRGQRGGINLHKNLLVATVLHKARTAYMMETYSYHQQQQRQRLEQEQLLQQQQQQQEEEEKQREVEATPIDSTNERTVEQNLAPTADVEMGQTAIATPVTCGEEKESRSAPSATPAPQTTETVTVTEERQSEGSALDKENHPPVEPPIHEGCDATKADSRIPDHLTAAAQLAQEAALSKDNSSNKNQTSGSTTCAGILKRRRDNPQASCTDSDCSATKKARVSSDASSSPSLSSRAASACQFTAINVDYSSSDESDSESDNEVSMMHTDSPQISNLVSIFNSGFSGLCATNKEQDNTFTPLSKLRPESPTPSSISRKLPEPSLMCSSEVGRLGSLPSAIVLSA